MRRYTHRLTERQIALDTRIALHARTHARTHTHAHTHTQPRALTHAHAHTYARTHAHTHTHSYTHTHIHARTHARTRARESKSISRCACRPVQAAGKQTDRQQAGRQTDRDTHTYAYVSAKAYALTHVPLCDTVDVKKKNVSFVGVSAANPRRGKADLVHR